MLFGVIIIIIKGHSLRRACLQLAKNTQNSKPRPPTTNAKSKGKLKNNCMLFGVVAYYYYYSFSVFR